MAKPIRVKINVACLYWRVERARPKEAESRGSGGHEDPRHRPMVATMDPGGRDDAALSQSPPEAASRLVGNPASATSVTLAERAAITAALAKVSQT